MAPKKKKKEGGTGGSGGGKEKPAAPTEVEREELRVKIYALEEKQQRTQQKLEAAVTDHGETRLLLEKQQADQADIVDYLKKEVEQKTAENAALEKKYIKLRVATENEEGRLCEALESSRLDGEATREVGEEAKHERARLESRLDEYETLKVLKVKNQDDMTLLEEELATCKAHLETARSQVEICVVAEGEDVGEDGSFAVPLLLLEAMRIYAAKPLLCEQACVALQSLLSGERKADCEVVRKNGQSCCTDCGHTMLTAAICTHAHAHAHTHARTRTRTRARTRIHTYRCESSYYYMLYRHAGTCPLHCSPTACCCQAACCCCSR